MASGFGNLMLDRIATAQDALDMGLVNRSVPADRVDAEVDGMVAELRSYDRVGVRFSKKWLDQYMRHSMTITGMGSLFAEGMVLSHAGFAGKVDGTAPLTWAAPAAAGGVSRRAARSAVRPARRCGGGTASTRPARGCRARSGCRPPAPSRAAGRPGCATGPGRRRSSR